MIIVGGIFEVDPAQRDVFLASRHEAMRTSRAEHGCIDYVFAADPIEQHRVMLFERWETQADLDAHLARLKAEGPRSGGVQPLSASIEVYTAEPQRRDKA